MKTYSYLSTPKSVIRKKLKKNYKMELSRSDAQIITEIVNQGIDSHLEAVTNSTFEWEEGKLHCDISPHSMATIIRRLGERTDDEALMLRTDILFTLGIEEI